MEGRNSESQHEEKNAQRENVGGLSKAWHVLGIVDLWSHVDRRSHLVRDQIVLGHRETEVAVLEDALIVDQNVLELDVHVRELALVVHLFKALHQLKANRPHQVVIAHNHPLPLAVDKAFSILALDILVNELEQVAVLAVLEHQVVANPNLAINHDWLLTFKCINFDDVGTRPQHLTDSVLVLGVVHHVLVDVLLEHLDADLSAVCISCQEDLGLQTVTYLPDSFDQLLAGSMS